MGRLRVESELWPDVVWGVMPWARARLVWFSFGWPAWHVRITAHITPSPEPWKRIVGFGQCLRKIVAMSLRVHLRLLVHQDHRSRRKSWNPTSTTQLLFWLLCFCWGGVLIFVSMLLLLHWTDQLLSLQVSAFVVQLLHICGFNYRGHHFLARHNLDQNIVYEISSRMFQVVLS